MFSLEKMIAITGDPEMMDHLERIAYNALPAQVSDDFSSRQYFQQANQVKLTRDRHNFYEEDHHGHTDLCFGLLTGYPCCTCNLHQGWPKLVTHLWYATPDGGLAALLFGPSRVTANVGNGAEVTIREETTYPFEDRIRFKIHTEDPVRFPFHLRIPGWCEEFTVRINGKLLEAEVDNGIVILDLAWNDGDELVLEMPMEIRFSRWVENSVSVERGPLVYVLRIGEEWTRVKNPDKYGDFFEVRPTDPWNYGLLESAILDPGTGFEWVDLGLQQGQYPWNLTSAPVILRTRGKTIPDWTLYRDMAGPLPHSLPLKHLQEKEAEEITLIPYGCSTLRITEFPVVR
jgi:hypothetical protein